MKKGKKQLDQSDGKYIRKSWTNPNSIAAFRGLSTFAKSRKITDIKGLERELSSLQSFSRHRPSRTTFPKRPLIVNRPLQIIISDLGDFQKYKRKNDGYGWLFLSIDPFTKKLFTSKLKKKSGEEMVEVLKQMLKFYKRKITSFTSDSGKEYFNSKVATFFKERNIHQYKTFSPRKAFSAERSLRTIKTLLWKYFTENNTTRWIDILPKLTASYNLTPHSVTKIAPDKVKEKDWPELINNMYGKYALQKPKTPKYAVGSKVRISIRKLVFDKKYKANFSKEIFTVHSIHTTYPVVSYLLADSDGAVLQGSYVDGELSLASSPEENQDVSG